MAKVAVDAVLQRAAKIAQRAAELDAAGEEAKELAALPEEERLPRTGISY